MEALVAGIVTLLAVALAAFGIGRTRGKAAGERLAEQAGREAQDQRVKAEAARERARIDDEIRQLPADSDGDRLSAADRLRRDWSRD